MANIKVNVIGESCPIPLIETRKAIKKAALGDVIEISGTNSASKKEIPMAAKALSVKIISEEQTGSIWTIKLQK